MISSHLMTLGKALRDVLEPMLQPLEKRKILFSTDQDKTWSLRGKMSVLQSQGLNFFNPICLITQLGKEQCISTGVLKPTNRKNRDKLKIIEVLLLVQVVCPKSFQLTNKFKYITICLLHDQKQDLHL